MEIQIDTSVLNYNNKLLYKIEEAAVKDLTEFSVGSVKSFTNQFFNLKENYLIRVDYFLIEKFSQICLVIYGEIIENNQTVYEYKKSEKVFAYTNNYQKIKEVLNKINQKNILIRIEIEEFEIIKFSVTNEDRWNILFILTHICSIIKIFFAMKKFKFNRWENLLIFSKFFPESFLLKTILNLIGYSVSINISKFLRKNEKKISKEEFLTNSLFEEIELINDEEEYSHSVFFDFIIETSSDFYENKLKYFSYLKNHGNLILIQDDPEINSQLDISRRQFDPRDFEVMTRKSLGISICNLKFLTKFNYSKGKELNFMNQILEKLISSKDINNNLEQNWNNLIEKCSIGVNDKFEDISAENIINSNNLINIFILIKN